MAAFDPLFHQCYVCQRVCSDIKVSINDLTSLLEIGDHFCWFFRPVLKEGLQFIHELTSFLQMWRPTSVVQWKCGRQLSERCTACGNMGHQNARDCYNFSKRDCQLQSCNGSLDDGCLRAVLHVETWVTRTLSTATTLLQWPLAAARTSSGDRSLEWTHLFHLRSHCIFKSTSFLCQFSFTCTLISKGRLALKRC